MNETTLRADDLGSDLRNDRRESVVDTYQPPTVEVISLDCEISAYAPDDGDVPLF